MRRFVMRLSSSTSWSYTHNVKPNYCHMWVKQKNETNVSAKRDWENHLSPQKYINNYRKLRNAQSRRGAFLLKHTSWFSSVKQSVWKPYILATLYKLNSLYFRNKSLIYNHTYMYNIYILHVRKISKIGDYEFEGEHRTYTGGLEGRKGKRKCN